MTVGLAILHMALVLLRMNASSVNDIAQENTSKPTFTHTEEFYFSKKQFQHLVQIIFVDHTNWIMDNDALKTAHLTSKKLVHPFLQFLPLFSPSKRH